MGSIFGDKSTAYCTLKNGSKQEILEMLQCNIDSKCIKDNDDTFLHAVLRNVNLKEIDVIAILTLLLNRGDKNFYEETALQLAIAKRMKKTVEMLLKYNADIHTVNRSGDTLAHSSIKDEYEKLIFIIQDRSRYTTEQHKKIKKEGINYLEFLISKNFDFDRKNVQGKSALDLATSYYYLQHLLPTFYEHTDDIRLIHSYGQRLFKPFIEKSALLARRSILSNENPYHTLYDSSYAARSVNILIERGIDVVFHDKFGVSLIRKAFKKKKDILFIKKLINHYLNNCHDTDFASTIFYELISTCAHWSVTENDYFFAILTDLIIKGADVDKENLLRKRPVHIAMEERDFRILVFLKENGADFALRSRRGQTLLHLFAEQTPKEESNRGIHSEAWFFTDCGGYDVNTTCNRGRSPLHTAVAYGNVPMVRALIDLGAEINCRDEKLWTPLHEALMMDQSIELIQLLVKNGADVNATNSIGDTPLHFAANNCNASIVRLLIEHGASVNCKNKYHMETPLHRAVVMNEALEIIEVLLACGADVNAQDCMGNTPPHRALNWWTPDSENLMKILLKNGAYTNTRNKNGQSILFSALSLGLNSVVRTILKHIRAELNEPCIQCLVRQINVGDSKQSVDLLLSQYKIKLKAAGLSYSLEYEAYDNGSGRSNQAELYDKCLKEIEKLKNNFITNSGVSLYTFLCVHPSRGTAYVKNEKLQRFIRSPTFNNEFPIYSDMIRYNYKQIVARKSILRRAEEAWYKITKDQLPDSIDHILAYLNNMDLIYVIKASKHVDVV